MKLSGKISIVTGGTSGIGKATGLLFAKEGSKVVLAGRDEKKGRVALDEIYAHDGEASFIKADVSKSDDVQKLVNETVKKYDRIDVLVNNAAIAPVGNLLETTEEVWDEVMGINLKGMFLCPSLSFLICCEVAEEQSSTLVL